MKRDDEQAPIRRKDRRAEAALDKRGAKRADKQGDAPRRQRGAASAKRRGGAAPGKRKGYTAVPGPVETTIKLGRSLRTGGAYVFKVSRKAYRGFNQITQSTGSEPGKARRTARTPLARNLTYMIFLLSIFIITSVALMVFNNSSVVIDRRTVSIVGLPKDLEGYTVLHISDLHGRSFGVRQTSLLRTINGLSYNLALFTGDMVGRSRDPQPFYELLEGMTANRPAFFISGDSDPSPLLDEPRAMVAPLSKLVLNDWVLGAQERGATYLSTTTGIKVGQSTLWLSPANLLSLDIQTTVLGLKEEVADLTDGTITGIASDHQALPFTDYRYQQAQKLDRAVREMKPGDVHLALSHYPPSREYIDVTQELGASPGDEYHYLPTVDLVLAGHYCGGGWKIPFLGALYVPNTMLPNHGWLPAEEDVQGLRPLGSTQLYTSPGLSVTDKLPLLLNFRLFNPPTVTLITLTGAITDDLLGDQ